VLGSLISAGQRFGKYAQEDSIVGGMVHLGGVLGRYRSNGGGVTLAHLTGARVHDDAPERAPTGESVAVHRLKAFRPSIYWQRALNATRLSNRRTFLRHDERATARLPFVAIRFRWMPAARMLHCTDAASWIAYTRACPGDWVCRAFILQQQQQQQQQQPGRGVAVELIGGEGTLFRKETIARARVLRNAYRNFTVGAGGPVLMV
jgi:hypothetical protein